MNTPLVPESTLADLAVPFPAASRVFRRHGLDYCCHGRRPVSWKNRIAWERVLSCIWAAEHP